MRPHRDRLVEFFFQTVDPIRLDFFRRGMALSFLVYMAWWFGMDRYEWLTAEGFHYDAISERQHIPARWPLLHTWAVWPFATVLFTALVGMITGFKPRLATAVALVCSLYLHWVDNISAFTINKLFTMSCVVIMLAPSPRDYPLPDGSTRRMQVVWPVRVLQLTIMIQYFGAGYCKAFTPKAGWITGAYDVIHHTVRLRLGTAWEAMGDVRFHPDVLYTHLQGIYRTDLAAWMLNHLPLWSITAMMISALLFELLAPLLFGVKKLRPIAFAWGAGFQLMIALTMNKLFFFSFELVMFYFLFVSVPTLHKLAVWQRLQRRALAVDQ